MEEGRFGEVKVELRSGRRSIVKRTKRVVMKEERGRVCKTQPESG
jgi:hypothetical protein